MHGAAHVKLPRSEINVIPAQRQQLTAAKTGRQRHDVQSLQPLAIDHIEQALGLRDVQAHAALAVDRWSLYLCRHVPGHQLQIENDEYAAFVRRILRAYSRRVGDGDVEALALMLGLAEEIDAAIAEAIKGLRPAATPGPRSAPGSASPARRHSNARGNCKYGRGRGRDRPYGNPAQIPVCGITALGSYHGWLAAKRCSG